MSWLSKATGIHIGGSWGISKDINRGYDAVTTFGGKAGRDFYHSLSQFGEGIIGLVESPAAHFSKGTEYGPGWSKSWSMLSESAPTVAGTAIVAAYGIDYFTSPSAPPAYSPPSYVVSPAEAAGNEGIAAQFGMNTIGASVIPEPVLPATGLEIEAASGTGMGTWEVPSSAAWYDPAISAGKYLGEKVAVPLALKALMPSPAAPASSGGVFVNIPGQGAEGGGGSTGSGGGGGLAGLLQDANGEPSWVLYGGLAIAAATLLLTLARGKG